MDKEIRSLNNIAKDLSFSDALGLLNDKYQNQIAFSTSLSPEDQIILDEIQRREMGVHIFTLDTGKLFPETYKLIQETEEKYQIKIDRYYPNEIALEEYISANTEEGFYKSIELRKSCCHIRKIEPLTRALSGHKIWISGVRKAHSDHRSNQQKFSFDSEFDLIKFYPLLDKPDSWVWQEAKIRKVPLNPLYLSGYPSLGCAPCTRPVPAGAHPRSGRWWWEDGHKECGIHIENGKIIRKENVK